MTLRWLCLIQSVSAGATATISLTSACAGIGAIRTRTTLGPNVWIENPFGATLGASILWHAVLSIVFALATILLLRLCAFDAATNSGVLGRRVRVGTSIAIAVLGLLAVKDSLVYYWLLERGQILSVFPVPLSLFLLGLFAITAIILCSFGQRAMRSNRLAMRFAPCELVVGSGSLILLHLITFGTTDYSRRSDVGIILGARVYSDGTLSPALADRVTAGVCRYRAGQVRYLLMTGGTGPEGVNEAEAMRRAAMAAGVPSDRILVDDSGNSTAQSARNCRRMMEEHRLADALVISHYYHLARCKLSFVDEGLRCATVPAAMRTRLIKEPYFLVRECVAYLAYCLKRTVDTEAHSVTDGMETPGENNLAAEPVGASDDCSSN